MRKNGGSLARHMCHAVRVRLMDPRLDQRESGAAFLVQQRDGPRGLVYIGDHREAMPRLAETISRVRLHRDGICPRPQIVDPLGADRDVSRSLLYLYRRRAFTVAVSANGYVPISN